MFSYSNAFFSLFPQAWPHLPCSQRDWWILNSAMKICSSMVVSLDTQFWAVSNYVYKHGFIYFFCKWNTVECITLIYIYPRYCNASRPDMALGGGGKQTSLNLLVWKKLVTLIWKQTHLGQNKWPTRSRRPFQMQFSQWKCFYIDSNITEIWGFLLNKSTLV